MTSVLATVMGLWVAAAAQAADVRYILARQGLTDRSDTNSSAVSGAVQ